MTNTIKASEVTPGMTVKWKRGKFTHEVPVERVHSTAGGRTTWFVNGVDGMSVQSDTQVTVLSEPAPAQPEEPRWVAARAKLRDYRFFRVDESDRPWRKADCMGRVFPYRYSWSDVCSLGPVTVIPDQGWTVPADTPEVPERIEEWPEDDAHLREQRWRDRTGAVWSSRDGQWGYHSFTMGWVGLATTRYPFDGPWVRVP